jgi:hypothetical protein
MIAGMRRANWNRELAHRISTFSVEDVECGPQGCRSARRERGRGVSRIFRVSGAGPAEKEFPRAIPDCSRSAIVCEVRLIFRSRPLQLAHLPRFGCPGPIQPSKSRRANCAHSSPCVKG